MSTNPPGPIPQNIGASAGPLLLGYLFNWCLFGVLSVQVYLYYLAFPRDRLSIKCLVFGLYIVETLQTILITHDVFDSFGSGYGMLSALESTQLEWLGVPIISGIVSCTVQTFFAYRIFVLSKSKPLGLIICVIALTQGASGIAQGVQALQINDFAKLQNEAFVSCTIWLGGAALCDIIIAVSMSYYLSKSETGFRSTHVLISKLIRLTIETGSMTAAVATIDMALFLAFRNNNYHATPALILAKLYSNTLVVILNSRLRIVDGRDTTQSIELNSYSSVWKDGRTRGKPLGRQNDQSQPSRRDGTRQIEVTVDTLSSQHGDWSGGTYTNQPEGMKVVALGDDTNERKANLMV
ncbi:hypothetical protein BD779DRAFT_1550380 [Infundibulicybe gibba]|nr:hypothetical protein BD779DRAFT_1550380 [Infundibulicybe gibba]